MVLPGALLMNTPSLMLPHWPPSPGTVPQYGERARGLSAVLISADEVALHNVAVAVPPSMVTPRPLPEMRLLSPADVPPMVLLWALSMYIPSTLSHTYIALDDDYRGAL